MQIKFTQSIQNIILLTLFIQLTSCSIGYNSISYTKSEGNVGQKIEDIRQKKKWSKTTFVHTPDTLYQLNDLSYYGGDGKELIITGEPVPVEKDYITAYQTLKRKKRKQVSQQEIAGPKGKYFKQTHIYTDRVNVNDKTIEIKSSNVKEATSYHRSRVVLFIVLGIIAIPFSLILALIIDISSNGLNVGPAV